MNFTKIFKLAEKFNKYAQPALSDAAIKEVVLDFYNTEATDVAPPDDIRIEYQETGDQPGAVQPRHYNVIIRTNSYLESGHARTLEDRLRQTFDPRDELYNISVDFFSRE